MKSMMMTFVLMLSSFGVVLEAEAARMGAGKSLGRQESMWSRPVAPAPAAPVAQPRSGVDPAGVATTATRGSRWAGPLAGLAAGGLIGALLFGGAFEGIQFLDVLLVLVIAVGIFAFLRARRRSRPAPVPMQTYAAAGPAAASGARVAAPVIGSGLGVPAPAPARPAWFDEAQFLRGAKQHFVNLQAAWDRGDLDKLREYAAPELYAELVRERQAPENAAPYTEVVKLDAELVGLRTYADHVLASVRYSGLISEARDAQPQPFVEVWNVQRSLDDARANWYVAGIQQQSGA